MKDKDPLILVVDDTEDNLDLLEFALKRKPVRMLRAASGKECLRIAKEAKPDVIILDIQMPEMDGFETLKHLRNSTITAKIPVIFLTAQRKDPESIEQGLLLGAEEYLTKPIDTDELLVRTKTLVRLKRAESELERTKADFTAMLVHDLRSPLAGIRDVISFLRELEGKNDRLSADHFALLKASHQSADKMLRLISDLLDLSKYEAGNITLQRIPVSICDVAQRSIHQIDFQFKQKGIVLDLVCAGDLPNVLADPDKLDQVFMNLMSNALKFTPKGGKVTVDIHRTEMKNGQDPTAAPMLEVMVKDSGPGIAKEDQAQLFERYKQATMAKKSHPKGTGLGLAICKLIVDAHGGTIGVDSKIGEYTAFFFTIPIA